MYQTEEQIKEKLQFDRASEDREEATEAGDKYNDENGTDPNSDLRDDELTSQNFENHSQDAIS